MKRFQPQLQSNKATNKLVKSHESPSGVRVSDKFQTDAQNKVTSAEIILEKIKKIRAYRRKLERRLRRRRNRKFEAVFLPIKPDREPAEEEEKINPLPPTWTLEDYGIGDFEKYYFTQEEIPKPPVRQVQTETSPEREDGGLSTTVQEKEVDSPYDSLGREQIDASAPSTSGELHSAELAPVNNMPPLGPGVPWPWVDWDFSVFDKYLNPPCDIPKYAKEQDKNEPAGSTGSSG